MKISIITVCLNSETTIAATIKSVVQQTYKGVEYIIIDGASTDKTLEIVNKYASQISRIISEKDLGIYCALNKGLQYASGEVIGFLHSDDFYYSNSVLSNVMLAFAKNNTDSLYGDLIYVDRDDTQKIRRHWKSGKYKRKKFLYGWMPPHPAFFVKKTAYDEYGVFRTDLSNSADYELMLRFLYRFKISTQYLPKVLVKMRTGGKSNVSIKNRLKANREDSKAWKVNNLNKPFYTVFMKPIRKIKQFFFRS